MVLNKFFILFFVVVLLCSLALPAFAFPSDLYRTYWYFDSSISAFPYFDSETDAGAQLTLYFGPDKEYGPYHTITWSDNSLKVFSNSESVWGMTLYNTTSGWLDPSYRYWYFSTGDDIETIPGIFQWLNQNAVCTKSGNVSFPIASFTISGSPPTVFQFGGSSTTPDVTLTVASTGALLSTPGRSKVWNNLSELTFTGFSIQQDNVPEYVVGQTYTIQGGLSQDTDLVLYPCFGTLDLPSVDIKIYNQSGSELLFSKSYSKVNTAPLVTVRVEEDRIEILIDDAVVDRIALDLEDGFLGLSSKPNQLNATWTVGSSFVLGGSANSVSSRLYTVWSGGVPVLPFADWTSWISSAVSGLFSFSFWPGLTLGDLFLTLIAIAVFFAFLKMTI